MRNWFLRLRKGSPSEAISRRVEPVRLKNVVQKQDIQRAVVSLKAEESLKMSDLEKVVLAQQSGKEFLAKTKIIPNKKEVAENQYRSSENQGEASRRKIEHPN